MAITRSPAPAALNINNDTAREPLPAIFRIGDWTLEPSTNRLRRGRQEARLEPKVADVLVYLAKHANRVVSREELEASVWRGSVVSYDTVTGAIRKLRRALGDNRAQARYIETLSKRGYRLVVPVRSSLLEDEPEGDVRPTGHSRHWRRQVLSFAGLLGVLLIAALAAVLWVTRSPDCASHVDDAAPTRIAALPSHILMMPT